MKKLLFILVLIFPAMIGAKNKISLGGRLFLDGGTFIASPSAFHSGVGIPEARITSKAYFDGGWYMKLDVGVASNEVKLKDAFLQKIKGKHMFRVGYMIGMFSLDQSSSTNDYVFMTGANVAETFYPGRRIGISYSYLNETIYVSGGVFCGDGLKLSDDVKPGKNATLRLVYKLKNEDGNLFHIGGGAFHRYPDRNVESGERIVALKSKGPTYLSAPSILDNEMDNVISQTQWNLESICLYRNLFFQAEYMQMNVNRSGVPNYQADGGYVEGGWFIKGDNFIYDDRDAVICCPEKENSLALFGRFNYTNLNSSQSKSGALCDISLGLNYYLNKNVIFRLNYSYLWSDKYAVVPCEQWNMLQTRVQVKF